MEGHGQAAARLAFLCLLLASCALARDLRGKKDETKDSSKDSGDLHGTSILVTTNSEGVSEVTVSQSNVSLSEFLELLNNLSTPISFIPGIKPFPRSGRVLNAVPLTGSLLSSYYPYSAFAPVPLSSIDLSRDSVVLVAPTPVDEKATPVTEKNEGDVVDYGVYILPRGLSSLPPDMSKKILSSKEGMKKIGLLMFPSDVDYMGVTGKPPSGGPFRLDGIKIREIKVVNGEKGDAKLDEVINSFGFGSPWLIIRDVAEDAGTKADAENAETPTTKERMADEADGKPVAAETVDPAGIIGTVYLSKDGGVTWELGPFVGSGAHIPFVRIPNPVIPPIPIPQIAVPPIPIPPIPPIPWFGGFPFANPFFPSFNVPFWNINPPNPFVYPVPVKK